MKWALAVLLLAAALRIPNLAQRPVHADEAIQAVRTGALLDSGKVPFDPADYHGPGLAYATLPVAWISGALRFPDLTEHTIRAVPVLFGLILVVVSYLIAGRTAALFTAVSPAMVYYSRDYIPEMLLVCLTAALILCGMRCTGMQRALACGVLAGLMYVTKETAVLALGAMAIGLAVVRPSIPMKHLLAGLVAALAVILICLPGDALRALPIYADRAFAPARHAHPWHYYLGVLSKAGDIVFLLIGLALVRIRDRLSLFLAVYAIALTAIYSLIPYKTPWCALGFLHAWILLAAIGLARLRYWELGALALLFIIPRTPYSYAETLPDVNRIRSQVDAVAQRHPDGPRMKIHIYSTENLWPLPWYLRRYPNARWWREVPAAGGRAPVILLSPSMEDAVARMLYELPPPGERELYINLFPLPVWLRPDAEVRGYVAYNHGNANRGPTLLDRSLRAGAAHLGTMETGAENWRLESALDLEPRP